MLFAYPIFDKTLDSIDFDNNKIINTINPHSYCVANKDLDFKEALKNSDILLPDGIGIVWAEWFLNGNSIKKIAGADIHQYLLQQANLKSQKVFYLGAAQSTLKLIEGKVKKEYPNITVSSFSPPYKPQFSESETALMLEKVNDFKPDILFVGMTAPKQEKWVFANKDNIDANTIVSIGAVFDFYAGNVNRAPKFIVKIGLEWLHRSLKSRRLLIRNLKSNPIFLYDIIKKKLK